MPVLRPAACAALWLIGSSVSSAALAFTPAAIAISLDGLYFATAKHPDTTVAQQQALSLCVSSDKGGSCRITTILGTNAAACATVTRNSVTTVIYSTWAYGQAANSVNASFQACQAGGGTCTFVTTICNN